MLFSDLFWLHFQLHTNPLPLDLDFYENCINRLEDLFGLNTNIGLIRERATEVCLGLQPLDLPALIVLEIVDMACSPYSDNVRMAAKWNVIVAVKHFRSSAKRDTTTARQLRKHSKTKAKTKVKRRINDLIV